MKLQDFVCWNSNATMSILHRKLGTVQNECYDFTNKNAINKMWKVFGMTIHLLRSLHRTANWFRTADMTRRISEWIPVALRRRQVPPQKASRRTHDDGLTLLVKNIGVSSPHTTVTAVGSEILSAVFDETDDQLQMNISVITSQTTWPRALRLPRRPPAILDAGHNACWDFLRQKD